MKLGTKILLASLATGALMLGSGAAQTAEAVELLDGRFGIFAYGDTSLNVSNKNTYEDASSSGHWNTELALLFTGKINDDFSIWTQIFGDREGIRLDWAFVEYNFNEALKARAGQIKTPLGIYNEIRDIKYLQLSTIPPLMYNEEADLIDEAFQGASAVYNLDLGANEFEFNLIGGQDVSYDDEEEEATAENQMFGGRITYRTPITGLSLLASGFTSKAEDDGEKGRANLVIGSIDYANHGFDLKAEYAWMKDIDEKKQSYYIQGGYTFFQKLTPFVRYDYLTNDRAERSEPAHYQKEVVVGVGYKFNSNIAFKVENHFIKGYAALPVDEDDPVERRKNWNLFTASINYIF